MLQSMGSQRVGHDSATELNGVFTSACMLIWEARVAQWYRTHLPMQETWVQSLGQEGSLEEETGTHSSILAWEIPWTEEPGGPQSIALQKSWT